VSTPRPRGTARSIGGGTTFHRTFHQPGDVTFSITFNAERDGANVASVLSQ